MKNNMDMILAAAVQNSQVPILILDQRWHELFPVGRKPANIVTLEEQLANLMKEQGKLVNEVKDLKRAKKKLMDEIVTNMNHLSEKKSKQNQKLIKEMNERIELDSQKVMDLPRQIKDANERLLVEGVQLCYHHLHGSSDTIDALAEEIKRLGESLDQKLQEKENLENEQNRVYSYMHDLLGPEIVELFDRD